MMRRPLLLTFLAVLAVPGAAQAAPKSVFGGSVPCAKRPDGITFCGTSVVGGVKTPARTLARTWDGTAIDVNVALPKGKPGKHGYPLVMLFHGYGGSKLGVDGGGGGIGSATNTMLPWLKAGYATFSMSDRGFGESCGTAASRASVPASWCAKGFNHLMDTRYEVRDAQFFAGELVDEGLVAPKQIAATGGSYGGGLSIALGALKDRTMLPSGKLVRWKTRKGTKLRLAAAAPLVPWTDLAYSLAPNGSTLDYLADAPYRGRLGVLKDAYTNSLYAVGCGTPTTFCTTADPSYDLATPLRILNAGEPYTAPRLRRFLRQLKRFHSVYGIDHSERPAPMLVANGWTDDLFPVDEALRYYNRTKTQYPKARMGLFFADLGHPRAQNKPADTRLYLRTSRRWLDHYVRGRKAEPFQGVTATTQACPSSSSSGGPFRAATYARLQRGEVRLGSAAVKAIQPSAGDPAIGKRFTSLGDACATADGATQRGTATYRRGVTGSFTLLGAPTVVARFRTPGATSQVAARLLDVGPDGTETLVGRGLWRPAVSRKAVRQVFQLHPGAWRFARGHEIKLELLPSDPPYGRASNGQEVVTVSRLQLRLPTVNRPGAAGGLVERPRAKVVPRGARLARQYRR